MTHVTIENTPSFVSYSVTTEDAGPFAIPFAIFEEADLQVLVDGVSIGAAFSFVATSSTTGGYQTGEITLDAAVEDSIVLIYRSISPTRTTDYAPGPLSRDAVNSALDRVHAILQDHRRDIDRAILADFGEEPDENIAADIALLADHVDELSQIADQLALLYAAGGMPLSLFGYDEDDPTTTTTAWNLALAAAENLTYGTSKIILPGGTLLFKSKPNAIDFPCRIETQGLNVTTLVRDYTESGGDGIPFIDVQASGVQLSGFVIWAGTGTTGGTAFRAKAPVDTNIAELNFDKVYVTPGLGTFARMVHFDGTDADVAPIGIRGLTIPMMTVFGSASSYSVIIDGVEGLAWLSGGVFPAGGSAVNSGRIKIGGTAAVPSEDINIRISDAGGIDLDYVRTGKIEITSGIPVTNANNSNAPNPVARTANTGPIELIDGTARLTDDYRNALINGGFSVNLPCRTTGIADDTYFTNRWYALTQSNPITFGQLTSQRTGSPGGCRLTQDNASAQRFGLAQIVRGKNCWKFRGGYVSLSAVLKSSTTQTLRYAILEWQGTADAVTSDVVNSWTNTSYTAGQFFNSTTLVVVATGSVAATAATEVPIHLNGQVSNSMNNLIVVFWTSDTCAQNVTLDVFDVQLEDGTLPTLFERLAYDDERNRCDAYYWKSFLESTKPAQNTGSLTNLPVSNQLQAAAATQWLHVLLPREMVTTPTVTLFNPQAANAQARNITAAADCASTAVTAWGPNSILVSFTTPAGGAIGDRIVVGIEAEAEL